VILFIAALASWAQEPTQHTVSATGEAEWVYEADHFGRFSFEVKSAQGAAIQLIDKMTGPGGTNGRIGEEDGRIDTFLDQGEVKVLTHADPRGEGDATITVTPFERLDGLQVLATGRPQKTDLADKQERAFWVEAKNNEIVAFEAVGRFVEDMRLWRDGSWLVDASPVCRSIEPVEGQPMRRCQLTTKVEAGQYQVSVYGGPGQLWAEPGEDEALYVVRGLPSEGAIGRKRFRIDGTGTNRLHVPKTVRYAHISLDDNAPVTLRASSLNRSAPYASGGTSASITEETRIPVADVRVSPANDGAVLTVEGPPGTDYILTWFDPLKPRAKVTGKGKTFVGTLQAADPADIPDPSGLLYRQVKVKQGVYRSILSHSMGLQLDGKHGYRKEFGIDGTLQILLDVQSEDRFIIESELAMQVVIEPALTDKPKGYQRPSAVSLPWDDTLVAGQYMLTLYPESPGITTLSIRPNGWGEWVKQKTGFGADVGGRAPGLMAVVDIDPGAELTLWSAEIPGVTSGLVVRDLPLEDLSDPIPLAMLPGETLNLPVSPEVDGILEALTIDGTALPISVDGATASDAPHLMLESHTIAVTNDGDEPIRAMLAYRPDSPPPALTRAPALKLPDFDELAKNAPAFVDLERDSQHTFLVKVGDPGLYRVTSTGLLATSGNLRGRVRLSLGSGDQNGVGRNFNVARYLRTADYQLSVRSRGRSAGHLGVSLVRARIADGGDLLDGIPARVTLPAGDAVRYTFTVEEQGKYRVQSRSQRGTFQCRIEDQDGWPRTAPSVGCDLTRELKPGTYGVLVLPEQVETRRITTMNRVLSEELRDGHGPHALALGKGARHVWVEPTDGAERTPDSWTFALPAEARVTLKAGDEMAGTVFRGDESVGRLVPGRSWTETLEAGDYRVEIVGARKGTGIPYRVSARTSELVVGVSRSVSVPSKQTVAVGEAGLITLASHGSTDVRAQLLDSDGNVVASNDDRPDDWNFRISTWVGAGRYRLVLDAVAGRGSTTVDVRAPEEQEVEATKAGKTLDLEIGSRTVVVPLDLPAKRDLIQARVRATETVGIAIEVEQQDGTWTSLARAAGRSPRVAARRLAGAPTRLRLWSLDERGGAVAVTAYDAKARPVGNSALEKGTTISASTPWPSVKIGGRTGLFALEGARTDVWVCPRAGQGCVPAPPVAPVTEDGLVILGSTLKGRRLPLTDEAVIALDELPVSVDVPDADVAVLIARTSTGQPGARFDVGPTALGDRAALAIDLGGPGRALVWRGSKQNTPVQTRLRAHRLEATRGSLESAGQTTVEVPANGAVEIDLGKQSQALRLGLERGTAVTVSNQAVWADDKAATTELVGRGKMWLLNPTDAPRLVTVESQDTTAETGLVGFEYSWERILPTAGLQTLAVAADDGGRLRVRGAELRYLRADGRVEVGDDLEVGPGGTAWLAHGPGTVLAWVERFDSPGPWRTLDTKDADLAAGAEIKLDGPVALNLNIGAPGVAHIRVSSPFVAWVGRVDVPQSVHVNETGGMLDLWLPDGTARIVLRGVADTSLSGTVSLTASNATEISEGLGPEVLLLPGSSRWFRFDVTADSLIGVGVSAEADRVLATVYSMDGAEVASGLIRRVELEAGTWLLALSQSSTGAPIRARPALAGVDRPDSGPPEDVVRKYLALAGLNPQGGE